jgi:alkylation response protein AidB-like acyl-CoA dehydrogenase
MFDLHAPGVTVRPIRQLGGRTGFAEIFLDQVFVPAADVIGEPGDGWRIAMSTASHERGMSLRSPGRFSAAAARLVELWRQAGDPAGTALRDRVVDAWIGAQAYRLHTHATAARLAAGGSLGAESSLGKVFWSELDVALHETALDLLGWQAELASPWPGAAAGPGAIGYTEEHDLHLWLLKVRALAGAWGSQAEHRARVMAAISVPSDGQATAAGEATVAERAVAAGQANASGQAAAGEPAWS